MLRSSAILLCALQPRQADRIVRGERARRQRRTSSGMGFPRTRLRPSSLFDKSGVVHRYVYTCGPLGPSRPLRSSLRQLATLQ